MQCRVDGKDGVCLFKYFVRSDDARRNRQSLGIGLDPLMWLMLGGNLFFFITIRGCSFFCPRKICGFPRKLGGSRSNTPAVKEARRDVRTKLRLAIKNKESGYNKTKRESRQNYEKVRNHTWSNKFKDFCDKIEAKSDSKRISSLIKCNKNTQLKTVKKPDGSLTETLSETFDDMTEVH